MEERLRHLGNYTDSTVVIDPRWAPDRWNNPDLYRVQEDVKRSRTHQRTRSEGHPFNAIKRRRSEDIGGDFETQKITLSPSRQIDWSSEGSRGWIYASQEYNDFSRSSWNAWESNSPCVSPDVLDSHGTTAISRCSPTNPVASAAQFLGELREGLPSIPGKALLKRGPSPKNIGGEYLNVEFGLKPLISDLGKFAEAYQNSEKILAQLERDSGRMVRRKYTFPTETVEKVEEFPDVFPAAGSSISIYSIGRGKLVRTETLKRKFKFSGAFTYYVPPKGTWRRTEFELAHLYGTRFDLGTAWELTPWSWAADWFGNFGDVVKNISQFSQDGLVLRYGYIMCHSTRHVDLTWTGEINQGNGWHPVTLKDSYTWETKQRKRATPYGFGIDLATDLSDRQLAIIAALGLSRGSGHR